MVFSITSKFLFCALFFSASVHASEAIIQYTIKPVIEEKKFEVELSFGTGEHGFTEIEVPADVSNLECFGEAGTLELVDAVILHQPFEKVRLAYAVSCREEENDYSACFLNEAFFEFTGGRVFITPKWEMNEKRNIDLVWKDIPESWTIANSFGICDTTQKLYASLFSLSFGLYVGGEQDVLRCNVAENSIPLEGLDFFASLRGLADYHLQLLSYQRAYLLMLLWQRS